MFDNVIHDPVVHANTRQMSEFMNERLYEMFRGLSNQTYQLFPVNSRNGLQFAMQLNFLTNTIVPTVHH